jgi:hypothetical protein
VISFFLIFPPSLRVWLSGLLFDHPPSLSFFHFFSLLSFFYLSFSFSFSLGFVSITIVTQLILNYTKSRDRNGT